MAGPRGSAGRPDRLWTVDCALVLFKVQGISAAYPPMASIDNGAATPGYEPCARRGHALVAYKGCTYAVGGLDSADKTIDPTLIGVFDGSTLKWQQHRATGEGPTSLFDAAYAVQANYLYVFGATASDDTLWRLDLQRLKWSITIQQKGSRPPSSEAKMVADREERLILCSNGKIYFFSIKDGEWSSLTVTGTTPPPSLLWFSFTLVGNQAVLYGGFDGGARSDVYCFDIDKKHWSKDSGHGPQPRARCGHAAVALSTQTLLMSGGSGAGGTLHDCWILDLSMMRWREVELSGGGVGRRYHGAAVIESGSTLRVVEFGGLHGSRTLDATSVMQMNLNSEGEGGTGIWKLVNYIKDVEKEREKRTIIIYEAALSDGYISTRNSVLVMTGAGGSGKTHAKEAISDRPSPSIHHSTALCEDPVTFAIIDATDGRWKVLDKEQQANMLASAMASRIKPKSNVELTTEHIPAPFTSASPPLPHDASLAETNSADGPQLVSITPTLDSVEKVSPSDSSEHNPPPLQPGHKEALRKSHHPVKSDIVKRIGQVQTTEPYNYDLVYLFDTGGQPAFHAILPLFFPLVMFVIFVLKLSERLDHHPKVNFFVRGKAVGTSYTSPLSHLEIAQHSFSAIQSQMLAHKHSKGLPKIMIVGTHRDLEWWCSESTTEKNRRLTDILGSSFQEHLIYRPVEGNSLIFPLDAKHRKQEDRKVAAEIRQAITEATSVIERKKTPLRWHILELALRKLAEKVCRGFLTRAECIAEAAKLEINELVFDAAINHFVYLNTILYYRTVLPDVVFIQAQPLMQKVSELIQQAHALRGKVPNETTPFDGKLVKFRDQGIVTLDILESFPDGYLKGVFTAAALVKLMEHKLLISPIDESSYFMPVLLQDLTPREVARHRIGSDSAIAPLSILFPCNLVPTGLFCSLVSSLLSAATPPQLHLKRSPSDVMECVASNCMKFSLPDNTGWLVLINAYTHLELHLSTPDIIQDLASICLPLKDKVFFSISIAMQALHFNELKPYHGFLCEASTPHAKVRVNPERHWLGRMVFGDYPQVEVDPPTHPAQLCGGHGWTCSRDPERVHGMLQRRHTVWLGDQQPSSSERPSPLLDEGAFDGTPSFVGPLTSLPSSVPGDCPALPFSTHPQRTEQITTLRPDSVPTLPLLISFPAKAKSINILRLLSTSYAMLGALLLDDTTGARVVAIEAEHRGNADRINQAIVQEWLQGGGKQPVSWATLTRAMAEVGQEVLAEQVTAELREPHPADCNL